MSAVSLQQACKEGRRGQRDVPSGGCWYSLIQPGGACCSLAFCCDASFAASSPACRRWLQGASWFNIITGPNMGGAPLLPLSACPVEAANAGAGGYDTAP